MVCGITTGFVYAASLMGVTGVQSVSAAAPALVERTRPHTHLPVAVGLGVSTAAQAADVAAYADGVIVGSAFVRLLLDAETPNAGVAAVGRLAADLAARRAPHPLSRPRHAGGPVAGSGTHGDVRSSDTLDESDPTRRSALPPGEE